MGDFKIWLEATESQRISSVQQAQALSKSVGLDASGVEFDLIERALASRLPVLYDNTFPLASIAKTPPGDKNKLLQMLGAFAQKLGVEPPKSLDQAQALKLRGPDFRKMTPPIIVQKGAGGLKVLDGVSRTTAAKLLRVWELRAFVIG